MNLVLKGYFCVVGVLALASTLQVVTQLALDNDRAAPLFTLPALWQLTELPTPVTRAGLAAFALGLVLFLVTLSLNIFALRLVNKYRERYD